MLVLVNQLLTGIFLTMQVFQGETVDREAPEQFTRSMIEALDGECRTELKLYTDGKDNFPPALSRPSERES